MNNDHDDDQLSLTPSTNTETATVSEPSDDVSDGSADEPKKELTFTDLAFKKNDKGELIVNVVNEDDFTEDTPCSVYNTSSGLGDDLYSDTAKFTHYGFDPRSSRLKVREPCDGDPWTALDAMVGLDAVKQQFRDVQNRVAFDSKRAAAGLNTSAPSNHFVFYGNPGTGKTEVTRILGGLFKESGVLERGHVVEVDRSDLVGEYVGQTAIRTKEAIKAARGGVLFIDEAYALYSSYENDFGHEAISTLVKAMEDERESTIIVMAGYRHEMDYLIRMNPGLQSRIRHHINFEDYDLAELCGIFEKFCADDHYMLDDDAREALKKMMKSAMKLNPERMGNGRFVRNVFDKTLEKTASRVIRLGLEAIEDLQTIRFSDIPSIEEMTGEKQGGKNSSRGSVQPLTSIDS